MSTTSQWWKHGHHNTIVEWHALMGFTRDSGFGPCTNGGSSPIRSMVATAGTILTLSVTLGTAPGVGASRTIAVRVNGVDSALSVTISGTNKTGTATGTLAVSAGDVVLLHATSSGAASSGINTSVEFEPTSADSYSYSGNYYYGDSFGSQISSAPQYAPLLDSSPYQQTSESLAHETRSLVPFAATITDFYVDLSAAPGTGTSWDLVIMVNGVENATSVINIAGSSTKGHLNGLSVAVAAGDYLTFKVKAANSSPASTWLGWAVVLSPTTSGLFCWNEITADSEASTTYYGSVGHIETNTGSEASVYPTIVPATLTAVALYVALGAAPGSGKSWSLNQRINGVTANLSAVVSGAAVTAGSDTAHSDSFAATDDIHYQLAASGSPSFTSGHMTAIALTTGSVGGGFTAKARRTVTQLGTRIGSRQVRAA
jgi:hypothetical protein